MYNMFQNHYCHAERPVREILDGLLSSGRSLGAADGAAGLKRPCLGPQGLSGEA